MGKKSITPTETQLRLEIEELRSRLTETEEALNAIRHGDVDAIVVTGSDGDKVFSLASAETPYRIIVEEMNEGAVSLSTDGTILYCNRRFAEIVSIPIEQLVGSNFARFVIKREKPKFDLLMQSGIKGRSSGEIIYFNHGSNPKHFHLSFNALPSNMLGAVCIMTTDITELKQKDKELRRSNDTLEQRITERTAELSKTIEELAASRITVMNMMEDTLKAKNYLEITNKHLIEEIIGHNEAEEALRKSEHEFRLLAETMPQIVWITRADGWNIYFNQQWVDYTGQSLEESYGHGWNKPFHPNDQQRAWDAWQNATKNGATYSIECRLRRADGVYKWWLIRGSPVMDDHGTILKWFGTCTDIDELKDSEEKLRESEQRLSDIIYSMADWVWEVDEHGVYTYSSKMGDDYFGSSREDVIGKTPFDFMPPVEAKRVAAIFSEIIKNKAPIKDLENWNIRKNGDRICLLTNGVPILDKEGNLKGYRGVDKDITDRKKAENELFKLNETLEKRVFERTKQLEKVNKELDFHINEIEQLTYIASHDLQEPLRTLTNFAQLFKEDYVGKLDENGNKYIEFIFNSATRMRLLVKGLLDYSLLGQKTIMTSVDCNKIVSEVLFDMTDSINLSGAKITVQGLPTLIGLETELRLLFQNLIHNAIKFRKKDVLPEINISAESLKNEWMFSVQDNGIGIEENDKETIFIIFQRTHNRNEYEGNGIGLAHCKKIVELHHGRIWVKSAPGRGSVFNFTIPNHN
jgi:PAS domain S-box-containing protein